MSLRSIGTLAQQRRAPTTVAGADGAAAAALTPEAAAATTGSFVTSLEAAIPTEVVALYTAVIAGCQSVLNQDARTTYLPFRLIIYLVALLCTVLIAFRSVHAAARKHDGPADTGRRQIARSPALRTATSPELLTASLSFAAWGLLLPGSFLYVWLTSPLLSVVVVSITATTAFLLAAVFAPKLRSPERSAAGPTAARPPMTLVPPTGDRSVSTPANGQ